MPTTTRLEARRERFVREYLVDLNATQAAIRAGYAPRNADVTAARLLVKASAEIAAAKKAQFKRHDLTADRVLNELARIGFSDIRLLFDEQNVLRPIHSLDEQTAGMISAVEQAALYEGKGEARKQIGVIKKVKLWDKVQALTTLAGISNPWSRMSKPSGHCRSSSRMRQLREPVVVNESEGTGNSHNADRKMVGFT